MRREWLDGATLHRPSASLTDVALLAPGIYVGGFLVWGVVDNVAAAAGMEEFVRFLDLRGFPAPQLAARLSVAIQLSCGLAIASGLIIRLAGALCTRNFAVAPVMVDLAPGVRGSFSAGVLTSWESISLPTAAGATRSTPPWFDGRPPRGPIA